MKRWKQLAFLLLTFGSLSASASEKVWVFFTDKDVSGFDPYRFFDQKAIDRRVKHGIDLYDITDVPVNPDYVSQVSQRVEELRVTSRWFNAVCCYANEDQIQVIRELPFVRDVRVVSDIQAHCAGIKVAKGQRVEDESFVPSQRDKKFLRAQVERMNGELFAQNNIDGKGVRVAIFDVGFKSYKTNPAFEHIRNRNGIIKTYNFVKKKENVDGWDTHGTFVLSCIGGMIEGQMMGLATGAEFLLARTETWTEYYSEEENWLAAAEWADKNGADVINSSLGYTYHRYFREDMDGQTSLVARAANMAARKGILVVNSAGNEGSANWKNIGTPADADSVLSIGGIHPNTGIHTRFSSFGPTWDKRLKPNVTAYGHVIGSGPNGISETQGTSFSGPLVAGFAACAMQTRPGYKNMQLFHEIEKSGDLYPYFDYAHGYGVPQARYFIKGSSASLPTFEIKRSRSQMITINVLPEDESLKEDDSRIEQMYVKWPDYVFYHIENNKGYLDKYFVVDPGPAATKSGEEKMEVPEQSTTSPSPLTILKSDYKKPYTIRVFYKGYVEEMKID